MTTTTKPYTVDELMQKIYDENFSHFDFMDNMNGGECDCNVEKLEFKTPDDIAYYTSAFSYTDSNCSFQRENSYNVPQDPARIVVKSDDKNYYRKSVYATTYTTIYSRNTLESTLYDRDNEIMNNLSYTSAYVYNEDDYPVSEIRTFLNGTVENYTYEYY